MSLAYHGRLPDWAPDGKDLFLTWRLHGSLPPHRYMPPKSLRSGHAFVCVDRLLDRATQGPRWLQQPAIAQVVAQALHYGDQVLHHYRLHAWVVMPNHVHLLISPCIALPKIMHSLKGFTAREANRKLNRTGLPFWQKEFFDHWIRNESEFERVSAYIERNPVTAGLAVAADQYHWSSAARKAGKEAGSSPKLATPQACKEINVLWSFLTHPSTSAPMPEELASARPSVQP